jgi:hypothetical protein
LKSDNYTGNWRQKFAIKKLPAVENGEIFNYSMTQSIHFDSATFYLSKRTITFHQACLHNFVIPLTSFTSSCSSLSLSDTFITEKKEKNKLAAENF